ncbi:MAG TPA: AsmA family protein [Bdellovibrionota bacterium]|nr:AsmA family protein [Bdellovibrionota bacterium]
MLKSVLVTIGILVGLVVAAALVLPFVIDFDTFRPQLVKRANESLNGTLSVGKLEVSLWKGITLQDVLLTNPDGFSEPHVVSVSRANVTFNLWKLLTGTPRFTVKLSEPTITLERSPIGWNIAKLLKEKEEIKEVPIAPEEKRLGFAGSLIQKASLSLKIKNAGISFFDQTKNRRFQITAVDLDLNNIALNKPITLDFEGNLDAMLLPEWDTKGRMGFQGTIFPHLNEDRSLNSMAIDGTFDFTKMLVVKEGTIDKQPGKLTTFSLQGNYSALDKKLDLKSFEFRIGDFFLKGSLDLSLAESPIMSTKFSSNEVDIDELRSVSPLLAKWTLGGKVQSAYQGAIQLSPLSLNGTGSINAKKLVVQFYPPKEKKPGSLVIKGPLYTTSEFQYAIEGKSITWADGKGSFDFKHASLFIENQFRKAEDVPLFLDGLFHFRDKTLSIEKGRLQLHTLASRLTGNLSFEENKTVDLTLSAPPINLQGWNGIILALGKYQPTGTLELKQLKVAGPLNNLSTGRIQADVVLEQLVVGAEVFKAKKMVATGPIAADGTLSFNLNNRTLINGSAKIDVNLDRTNLKKEKVFDKPSGIPLHGTLNLSATNDQVLIQTALIKAVNAEVQASGEVTSFKEGVVNTNIDIKPFQLQPWKPILTALKNVSLDARLDGSIKLQGSLKKTGELKFGGTGRVRNGQGKIEGIHPMVRDLSADLKFTDKGAIIEQLAMNIGRSDIQMAGTLTDFKNARGTVELNSKFLDLDELFPPEPPTIVPAPSKKPQPTPVPVTKMPDPFKIFREGEFWKKAILKGSLNAKQIYSRRMTLGPLQAALIYRERKFILEDFSLGMYEGVVTANSELDASRLPAPFRIWGSAKNINLSKMLTAKNPSLKETIEGRMSTDFHLEGVGFSREEVRNTLSGQGKLNILDAEFKTLDVTDTIYEALESIPGVKLRERPKEKRFQFAKANFTVSGGRVTTNDLYLRGQGFSIKGHGFFDFDQHLDYRADYYLTPEEDPLQAIPFKIGGSLQHPAIKPDIREYVKRYLQTTLEETLKKGAEKILEELGQ